MEVNELVEKDRNFTESGFLAKVDNTYIMLLSAIMTENMDRVKHKISSNLFNQYEEYVKKLSIENKRQMYDELNVKTSKIEKIDDQEDKFVITVSLISRYMDYLIDKTTGEYLSGENKRRIEKKHILIFEKVKAASQEVSARKCPGCGANMDVNNTGKCAYCGTIYNTQDYDWVLVKIIK